MKVDFSSYLDLNSKPKQNIKPLDVSKFKKNKTGGESFDFSIGDPRENSALTQVVTIKETYFNPNDYIINCNDLSLYCAAMFGGPLY